ncbi:hypothetical protein ACN9MF_12815 [Methylobacterium fujisawaense]|uniref:hypothetical protein n=1 Tax=Methylobacterium fujisawaense TaxID=107400 RepID=UPI003CF0A94B
MALPKPSLGATPAANVARIGDAFDLLDGLVAALADEQAARVAGLAAEGRARDGAIAAAVAAEGQRCEAAVVAEGRARGDAIAREQQDRTAAVVAEGRARAASDTALGALIERYRADGVADTARVGEAGWAFAFAATVAELQGDGSALPALPGALRAFGDNGAVARLTGPGLVATRRRVAIEPGRVYRARWVVQRRADAADPANDAIRLGIAWFDQAGNRLPDGAGSSFTAVADLKGTTVAAGRVERQTTLGRQAGAGTLVVAPRAARYARPFVRVFGPDPVTDIEVLQLDDVSNAVVFAPLAADALARLTALESGHLAVRVAALESAAQTPLCLTFASRGDAAAATIPAQVTTLALRGRMQAGDGRGGDYLRVATPPPAGQGFRSRDGAYWQFVRPLDLALGGQPSVADPGPAWSGYRRLHDTFRVAVNDYPADAQFGSNLFGVTEAVVGAVEVPAASDAGNHSVGVAGYARTSSSSQGGVGLFGGAFAGANGQAPGAASIWGANTLVSNCAHHVDPWGFTDVIAYGIELDFNIRRQKDGSDVNVPVRGLYFIGDSDTNGLAICTVIEVDQIGINRGIPWKTVLVTNDGAAQVALDIGATARTPNAGSQPINLRAIGPGGAGRAGLIQLSPLGDLVLSPHRGSGVNVVDTAGSIALQAAAGLFKVNADGSGARPVTYGAPDSAGAGYRALRVPN